jgi:hypothetical protein
MGLIRSEEKWTRLAARLYSSAGDVSFLERMTVALNDGLGMGVTQWSGLDRATLTPSGTAWSRPSPASLYAEYERNYAQHDPRVHAAFQNFGQFLPCWRLVDAEAFEKSIIVNEWSDRRDIDTRWTSICVWGIDESNLGLLALCRPRKDGPIQLDELKIVKRLRSHVRRAAQLHFLFREQPPRGRAFNDAWGSRSQAVFVLGRGRRLLSYNGAGQELLGAGDVFQTRWGELTAREPHLLAALDNALSAARKFDLDISPRQIAVAWPRFGGMTAIKAEVMALPGLSAEVGLGERAEAVVMCREFPRVSWARAGGVGAPRKTGP